MSIPPMTASISSVTDLLHMIESNEAEKWQEIKHLIYESYHEIKDSWLVQMLYDLHSQSGSSRCLELLLNVREPHEKFLLDKIAEGIKLNQGKSRQTALAMLGFVVRKQPSWLYRMTQHPLMKELLKVLKQEDDLVLMMSALMNLLVLLPMVPVYIAPYLPDLFEIFSRVAAWRYTSIKVLPEVQQVHVQVGLYAFFHRLYGMFPCNFLSYLRVHYSENNRENHAVFTHTIKPMLTTVKMHPMLVTQTRDYEKTATRWKRMELHDIIVESSRYSLDANESTKEDDLQPPNRPPGWMNDVDSYSLKSQSESGGDVNSILDTFWTPSRKCELNSPTPATLDNINSNQSTKLNMESPPEAAIEATPETTPFVTPVKDDTFKFVRPLPSNVVSRQLNLDAAAAKLKSPASISSSSILSPISSKEPSPFRFPTDSHGGGHPFVERRDSIFCGGTSVDAKVKMTPQSTLEVFTPSAPLTSSTLTPGTVHSHQVHNIGGSYAHSNVSSVAISNSVLLGSLNKPSGGSSGLSTTSSTGGGGAKPRATPVDLTRPSPVKFTNQRPDQFPIRPEPIPHDVAAAMKHKMLSLEKLKDLRDLDCDINVDDDEVVELTGGNDDPGQHHLNTRHITPKFLPESGHTSRALSSSSIQSDSIKVTSSTTMSPNILVTVPPTTSISTEASTNCQSGGLHPPSNASMKEFVRVARRRIKYISVCGAGGTVPADIAAEVASALKVSSSPMSMLKAKQRQTLKRTSSCPDMHQILEIVAAKNKNYYPNHPEEEELSGKSNIKTIDEVSADDAGDETMIQDDSCAAKAVNASVQTDEFLVSPYEHLFPFVIPQWIPNSAAADNSRKMPTGDTPTPYLLLDHYVEAAYKSTGDQGGGIETDLGKLREEIALLHSQLLYERHRRETLGLRNRRLLGKTKSSRVLEEQNTSLNDRLQIASSEMSVLSEQLEQLRKEKHQSDEEHILKERERDLTIEVLTKEKLEVKQRKDDLQIKLTGQAEDLEKARSEILKLEAALFNAKNDVDRLEKKEDLRKATETELVDARKEILLQGELLRKYREKFLDKPLASRQEQKSLVKETYKHQMNALRAEMTTKASEVEALKARNLELEESHMRQDDAINAMKRQTKKICDEYEEQVRGVENAYEALKHSYVQLEVRTMELQSQLALNRGKHSMNRSGSNSSMQVNPGRSSSSTQKRRGSSTTTANVDIELPAAVLAGTGGLVDRTFMVGSPPSSNGSIGSDKSEVIRRALEMGGIVQDGFVLSDGENRSPEIGSAVSAREAFSVTAAATAAAMVSSNSSSVNNGLGGLGLK